MDDKFLNFCIAYVVEMMNHLQTIPDVKSYQGV